MPYADETRMTRLERTERFDRVLIFLRDKGGTYQRRLEDFAGDVELTMNSLRAVLRRLEEHKLIRIEATASPVIGSGRFPNTYKLLVTPESWWKRREGYLEGLAHKKQAVALSIRHEAERAILAAERAQARQERDRKAELLVLERRAALLPAPAPLEVVYEPVPAGELDVDAWADAYDFDPYDD